VSQSTPKNVQQFKAALDSLNNFLEEEAVGSEELKMLREKLTKAATTWTAEIDILRKDNADFFNHSQQKQQAASRKRKQIPGGQAYTLEEVRNALKTPQRPTQRPRPRLNTR
jgi:small-conductance mechanosensitive channel